MRGAAAPVGYRSVDAGRCTVVAREEHVADARVLLAEGSLYEAAARDLAARPLQGRGIAYAVLLPVTRTPAVVRHNRHGGLFARLTGDLFRAPTRAPCELRTALRLAASGVRTPDVLMYGVISAPLGFARSDVMTHEIVGGRDLSTFMLPDERQAPRAAAWTAARALLRALAAAGARHHDLNVKNVLLASEEGTLVAYLLDVDRVTFHSPASAAVHEGNVRRLLRSACKWRDERGAVFDLDARYFQG